MFILHFLWWGFLIFMLAKFCDKYDKEHPPRR